MTEHYSRRKVLASTALVGAAALAGCTGGGDGDGGNDGGDETTTESTTTESNSGSTNWEETSTVEMTDGLKFEPKNIQVSAGTTVTWENVGAVAHSVTAYEDKIPDDAKYFASGGFDSQSAAEDGYPDEGSIAEGETYEHTFETTGTYEYYCIPHEMSGMVGKVKVV
jgi:plastocyanin